MPTARQDDASQTSRLQRHDILFDQVKIGPKVAPNRFYQVPYGPGFGPIKPLTHALYRSIRAEGGWGVVSTGITDISVDSDELPTPTDRLWDAADARGLKAMVDGVHEHGSLAAIELGHMGSNSVTWESRWPAVGPSQLGSPLIPNTTPKAIEHSDIERIQADWVASATRAADNGFDVIYVYGSDSYLPSQFLSPFYNKRDDEYGGSLENRARFWLECIEAVRGAVGERCAVAVRIAADGMGPMGIDIDETLAFVRMADSMVDLWDINLGTDWDHDSGSSRFFAPGYQLEWSGRIREATSKPIVGVGRMTDPDQMVKIIESGVLDLIGGARPSIADPFLPNKIRDGKYEEIRECIGANHCTMRAIKGHLGCIQNATAGEEYRRGWHPESYAPVADGAQDALVVGAGPAGMECATVLGRRGVRVHLCDKAGALGGHIAWMSRLPGMSEWGRITTYRKLLLERLSEVELRLGSELTSEEAMNYGADIIVVATGAAWSKDGLNPFTHAAIPGADAEHVFRPEEVITLGAEFPGDKVIIFDTDNYLMAPVTAQHLASSGKDVEIITPYPSVGGVSDEMLEGPFTRAQLHENGVRMRTDTMVGSIGSNTVQTDYYGDEAEVAADAVVLVTQRLSDDRLFKELNAAGDARSKAGVKALYRVGDCVAPRLVSDVIFDGHRLAREIDTDEPATPLSFLRESRGVVA
jgi:dimethylamine/trimethylamine dehydrogenase